MRPTASNINTPTEKLAQLMLNIVERYPIKHGFSVKSSVDFTGKVQSVRLRRGEAMVSFDVKAFFLIVPVDKAVEFLERHLRREGASAEETTICTSVAKTCMKQNLFLVSRKDIPTGIWLEYGLKDIALLGQRVHE